jgi:taurine dioxygenase
MKVQTATGTPAQTDFQILPLSGLMGAEVIGLDLGRPLDELTRERIHDAFLKYQILVFRGQKLTKQQQVAFTEQFGPLERHTLRNKGTNDVPLVHVVTNMDDDGNLLGRVKSDAWHSDKSFRPAPSMATILHAVTMPPSGGDTMFANMYAAYDALPEAEKRELADVKVIHSWEFSRENIGRVMSDEERRDAPTNSHPLVRVHPETGRKALFVGIHACGLEGMSPEAGQERIKKLEEHATRDEFVYRHNWRPGDLVMWDNRCLLHRADGNFETAKYPRVLHRTCLRGTPTS